MSTSCTVLKTSLFLCKASELFPTENRGMAHGISAAVGKLGALSADIIMGQVCSAALSQRTI
jgi:nitrate/nitrite transporter NarK